MKHLLILLLFFVARLQAQEVDCIITNSEVDLIPEGIAIDHKTGKIYVSSINKHKIITFNSKGETKDFIKSNQDGFMEGLGLKVDEKRGWLWALSVLRKEKLFYSRIHAFDLKTGKTMQQYGIQDTLPHLFNDLVISSDGNLFITDTYFSSIYKLEPSKKKLTLLVQSPLLRYPNGLTFGNNALYIATYRNGIVKLDTSTKEIKKITGITDSLIAYGLDGLVYHKQSLYGVYNTGKEQKDNCVIRYDLSSDGSVISDEEVLCSGVPFFADPTTAALYKNSLYVIANSHLDVFNANKMSTIGIENALKKLKIVKLKLD